VIAVTSMFSMGNHRLVKARQKGEPVEAMV
jgi:hypothetical protein